MKEKKLRMDEINPKRLVLDLLRNAWVALLLAAAVYLGMSAYDTAHYTPKYTSRATIVVTAKGSTGAYSSLSVTNNMAKVFSEVFRSNVLRERVEEEMNGEKLDGYISTSIVTNTNLMIISVVSSNPEQAFRALNLVLEVYPQVTHTMFSNAVLEVLDRPKVPTAPTNTKNAGRMKLTLAAFVLSMGLIGALSILRPTVQTPAAAKRRLDANLLRAVHHESRSKSLRSMRRRRNIAPLVTSHLTSARFREENQSLCAKLEYHARKAGHKVILVSSAAENEGKSTIAANLALSLAAMEKRVALLDCDFRKPAMHKIFEIRPDEAHSLAANVNGNSLAPESLMHLTRQGIFLGANTASTRDPQRILHSPALKNGLEVLREEFDYIILDSPPMLAAADAQTLAPMADTAVLVVREDYSRIRDINDCVDTLRRGCGDVTGFVLNNCLTGLRH